MFTARYGLIPYVKQITFSLYKISNVMQFCLHSPLPHHSMVLQYMDKFPFN
jgi:hypothetical protein